MAISTKAELQFLLHRCWEIEKKFESLSALEGFVSIGSPYRSTVLKLVKESYRHRIALETLIDKLGLDAPVQEFPETTFDFGGMLDAEILQKIIEQDEIAKDLYTELLKNTDPKTVSVCCGSENVDFFFQILKQIIVQETRHISLVSGLTGTIERVQ